MQNRAHSTISHLSSEIIADILDRLDVISLSHVKAIASSSNNPFEKKYSYQEKREQARWEMLTHLHFSHFIKQLPPAYEIKDWKKYFIECYENSYICLFSEDDDSSRKVSIDPSRLIRLFIMARHCDIDGLRKSELRYQELNLSLKGLKSQPLYHFGFGSQQLSDFFYHEVVFPAYKTGLIETKHLHYWAITFNQPITLTLHQISKISHYSIPHFNAYRAGNLGTIDDLLKAVEERGITCEWSSAYSTLITFKHIEERVMNGSSIFSLIKYSISNKNPEVFHYLLEKHQSSLTKQELTALLKEAISTQNSICFDLLVETSISLKIMDQDIAKVLLDHFKKVIESITHDKFYDYRSLLDIINIILKHVDKEILNTLLQMDILVSIIIKHIQSPIFENFAYAIYGEKNSQRLKKTISHHILPNSESLNGIYASMWSESNNITLLYRRAIPFLPFSLVKELYCKYKNNPDFIRCLQSLPPEDIRDLIQYQPHKIQFLFSQQTFFYYGTALRTAAQKKDFSLLKKIFVSQLMNNGELDKNKLTQLFIGTLTTNNNDFLPIILHLLPEMAPTFIEIDQSILRAYGSGVNRLIEHVITSPYSSEKLILDLLRADTCQRSDISNEQPTELPLNIAARNKRIDIFNALLQHNADIHQALTAISLHNDLSLSDFEYQLRLFIRYGGNINTMNERTTLPLLASAFKSNCREQMIEELILQGADIYLALSTLYQYQEKHEEKKYCLQFALAKLQCSFEIYQKLTKKGGQLAISPDTQLLFQLYPLIREYKERSNNNYSNLPFFKDKKILSKQRSALEKRKAAYALLGAMLSGEESNIHDEYKQDLDHGRLGKVYLIWSAQKPATQLASSSHSSSNHS